jgi:hypothetical protein
VLVIDFNYPDIEKGRYKPVVRNINMENVTSKKSKNALFLQGFEDAPITGVTLKNCTLDNVTNPDVISNVKNLVLENVTINGKPASGNSVDAD